MRFARCFACGKVGCALNSLRNWSGTGFREPGLGAQNAFLGCENGGKIDFCLAHLSGSRGDRDAIGVCLDAI